VIFGKLERVENLDRKPGAAQDYYRVMVKAQTGLETLLMTDVELSIMQDRASKNPEDTAMVPSSWNRFLSWLTG
tara:strand:+ start:4527 stop:4748 length:222 start_codon:yes stop_codon:yes gene_type:complete